MTCWTLIGHAVELREKGVTLVAPGVAVRLDGDGHTAVVYGGHRESVDEQAVLAAARLALDEWPVVIENAEIVVTDPERLTQHELSAIARAQAKRDRRAQKAARIHNTDRSGRKEADEVRRVLEEINRR